MRDYLWQNKIFLSNIQPTGTRSWMDDFYWKFFLHLSSSSSKLHFFLIPRLNKHWCVQCKNSILVNLFSYSLTKLRFQTLNLMHEILFPQTKFYLSFSLFTRIYCESSAVTQPFHRAFNGH